MKRETVCFIVALLMSTMAVASCSLARGMEVVHFPSALLPSAKSEPNGQANSTGPARGHPIWGDLGKPESAGPFPAIVLMHGCSGIQESHLRWAKLLNAAGYVTLVLDSFRPRSIVRICSRSVSVPSQPSRALDAYGALEYLQGLAIVDDGRIGLMGWSHGGGSALAAVSEFGIAEKFSKHFQMAIALYPFCISDRSFEVPVLVLIGSSDDWTPAKYCRQLRRNNTGRVSPITLKVYAGAFHGFDDVDLGAGFFIPGEPGGRHWLQYNREAHQDAVERVKRFLAKHLSR
jgi:dienelactone hydrolase